MRMIGFLRGCNAVTCITTTNYWLLTSEHCRHHCDWSLPMLLSSDWSVVTLGTTHGMTVMQTENWGEITACICSALWPGQCQWTWETWDLALDLALDLAPATSSPQLQTNIRNTAQSSASPHNCDTELLRVRKISVLCFSLQKRTTKIGHKKLTGTRRLGVVNHQARIIWNNCDLTAVWCTPFHLVATHFKVGINRSQ